MKKFMLALLMTALLCPAALAADTPAAPQMVMGRAPAAGVSETAAQDAALKDALRQAVARAVTESADPAALKGRLEAVEREVLSQAQRFVANYGVQSSGRSGDSVTVLAAVTVDRPALDKALAGLGLGKSAAPAPGAPLVLALISEETSPERPPVFWWSEIPGQDALPAPLVKALSGGKYRLVEPKALLGRVPLALRQAALSEDQALQLGRLAGANLVLLGRVRSYPLVTAPDENPSPAAQMEALSVAGGQALATAEEIGPVFNAPPGPEAAEKLAQAAEAAARRLLEQAAAAAKAAPAGGGGMVTMEVAGLRGLADIMRFEEAVAGLTPMVSELARESLSGGVATYRLRASGPLARLAEELKALSPAGLAVSVAEAGPDRLKVSLAPKP